MDVKWYGINALEFRHNHGSFMIDPYVSRDREKLTIPEEVDRYLTSKPDFVLMTHAHWDHLPDLPRLIQKTGTTLVASKTACNIMRTCGVPEQNLRELSYGEVLSLPGGVFITAMESRHMGIEGEPEGYSEQPSPDALKTAQGWKCGEIFSFLIEVDGKTVMNIGSANLWPPSMSGMDCNYLFCGISRWKDGFPELLTRNVHFDCLIPTHHDEFTLPLSQFHLRNDLERLKKILPDLKYRQLPILDWQELP